MGKNALNKIEEKINQCVLNLFLNTTTTNYVNNVKERIQIKQIADQEILSVKKKRNLRTHRGKEEKMTKNQ